MSTPTNTDVEFEVEEILDAQKFRCEDGKRRVWYLVKFQNFPDSENQWLPASQCKCKALARQFYRKKREQGAGENVVVPTSPSAPSPTLTDPPSPTPSSPSPEYSPLPCPVSSSSSFTSSRLFSLISPTPPSPTSSSLSFPSTSTPSPTSPSLTFPSPTTPSQAFSSSNDSPLTSPDRDPATTSAELKKKRINSLKRRLRNMDKIAKHIGFATIVCSGAIWPTPVEIPNIGQPRILIF